MRQRIYLLIQPLRQQVSYFHIVQIRHREVRIPMQTDIGQMNDRHVTAQLIEHFGPLAHEMQTACPFVKFRMFVCFGQVIPIVNDDGNFHVSLENCHRDFYSFCFFRPCQDFAFFGNLTGWEGYTSTGFVCYNGFDVLRFEQSKPTHRTAL